MLPSAQRRVIAVMVGVLLAGLLILMPVTKANAQDRVNCTDPILSGVKADATLVVDGDNRTYPHLTATTKYEIPRTWPGVAALLGRPEDENYQFALRCFLASWPLDKIAQVGEYRQQPPALEIDQEKPAANGQKAIPPQIVLHDEVTGDLTSRTTPPLVGPWEVTLNSDQLQLQLITKDREASRPTAFNSMTWAVHVQLKGLHFHHLEPRPVSTDSDQNASWAPLTSTKIDSLKISTKLGLPAHVAISSDSGGWAVTSYISVAIIDMFFYVTLLFLLRRKVFEEKVWPQVSEYVRAARWISILGLFLEFSLSIFRTAAYWRYGRNDVFDGMGIPSGYWKWSGLIGISTVGLIIFILPAWMNRVLHVHVQMSRALRALLASFGLILISYGTTILLFPEWFNLTSNFTLKTARKTGLGAANIFSGGGQLTLMALLTWAVLFATTTVLAFIFWSMRPSFAQDTAEATRLHSALVWKFLAASFVATLALMGQWVYQQVDLWNRTHVFPAFAPDRSGRLIADVTSKMVAYHLDLFTELVANSVPWVATAVIIFMLCQLGRSTQNIVPSSMAEYRLLGILFAAVVVRTESWYVGFTVRITSVAAFAIVGFILPWAHRRRWARRFDPLRTICVPRGTAQEQQERPELLTILPKPTDLSDLRARLFDQQEKMDLLQEQASRLAADWTSRKVNSREYENKKLEIENSLTECRLHTLADQWELPWNVRPSDVALAIGPRTSWWENGILAARIGAFLSIPAVAYFSYKRTEAGKIGAFNNYLGLFRLLCSTVWEIGFWVVAAFVLGCLWTTLPGRRWSVKGAVLWAGLAIPSAVDFILGHELLHQGLVAEEGRGLPAGGVLRLLLLLSELCLVGLAFDWFTFHEATEFRIFKRKFPASLYGVRQLVPTLAEVAVPLLASLIGAYIKIKTGDESHSVFLPPAAPRE